MTKNEEIISELFKKIISSYEIDEETKGGFVIYTVKNENGPIFSFGYNKKIGKYGIKRDIQMKFLYSIMNIPYHVKPTNFKEMYDLMKSEYILQVVQNTVKSIYDMIPHNYDHTW